MNIDSLGTATNGVMILRKAALRQPGLKHFKVFSADGNDPAIGLPGLCVKTFSGFRVAVDTQWIQPMAADDDFPEFGCGTQCQKNRICLFNRHALR